jgi:hypothetical protein
MIALQHVVFALEVLVPKQAVQSATEEAVALGRNHDVYLTRFFFLTYIVFDEAVGEEVECLEMVPCRRCADN